MVLELGGLGLCVAGGAVAHGIRGRSSQLFGASVWRGPAGKQSVALTFDDGPSESTPELLDVLGKHNVPATFFQCGVNVRRIPSVARAVAEAGHEIGNHTDTHPWLLFRSRSFIKDELSRAQDSIAEATSHAPSLFRAPYGVRWFGLSSVQQELGLLGVMWTTIGRDWRLPARKIFTRVRKHICDGAIICLHDGRSTQPRPDIHSTVEAARRLIPEFQARGFRFETVSRLISEK
jgi:peptidoglycan/xylan/chitin deacetylase (PgdA/CDA1 family)